MLTKNSRSEAQAIPHVMFAPKSPTADGENDRAIYDSGYGDARGYYEDGAYVAAPPIGPVMPTKYSPTTSQDASSVSPHDVYTSRLLKSFQSQRTLLRSTHPSSAVDALNPKHCIVVLKGPFKSAFGEWQRAITSIDPSPVQIATLKNWSVLRLLRLATSSLKRGKNLPVRMGAWAWALLAKLDYGILNRSEGSIVRDFGKKAVWMRLGFDERLAEATQGLVEPYEEDEEDEEETEVQEEKFDAPDPVADADAPVEDQEVEMDISSEEDGEILENDDENGKGGGMSKTTDSFSGELSNPSPSSKDTLYANPHLSHKRNASTSSMPDDAGTVGKPKKLKTKADAFIDGEAAIAAAKVNLMSHMGRLVEDGDVADVSELSMKAMEDTSMTGEQVEKLPNDITKATLDMIILIVGEVFGQRDLLEFREKWVRDEVE
jgi:hypothetical protein